VFKTADGHINIATTGHQMWERLCKAIGAAELMENPDYKTSAARSKNRNALSVEIDKRTETRSSMDWIEALNAAGVPCGEINSIDQVFANPQVQHLGIAQDVATANGEKTTLVGQPIGLSRTPSRLATATPELGQHTDEVLKEFGFSAQDIDGLRTAKAI
jgi:formyl-CoA transferase